MSAIPQLVPHDDVQSIANDTSLNAQFLKFLPAVTKHAQIKFRHLNKIDREEAVAEATAAAYINLHQASRNGRSHRIKPSTLAHYAILHVKNGRRVGGRDSRTDVMSPKAQKRLGFKIVGLPWDHKFRYDCLRDPTAPVWKDVLLDDKATPVLDQVRFRIDWSDFVGQQTDRTRTCLAFLAAGHQRREVADRMGTTPPAVTQRMARVEREWDRFQGIDVDETQNPVSPESNSVV